MPPPPDHPGPVRREDLAEHTERILRPARGAKPAILLVRAGGRRVLVKDFSSNPWLLRHTYGRWIVRHESRIYARLAGVRGVPAFRGRLDRFAFATDYVEGHSLKALRRRHVPPEAFDRLRALVEGLHAAGVVHLDCHQKANVILPPDGQPHLVDFATALYLGRHWLARRVLVPLLGRADRLGVLKLKGRYCPDALAPDEARRFRWAMRLRFLWPPTLVRRIGRRAERRAHRRTSTDT
jgi:hypothetical protein